MKTNGQIYITGAENGRRWDWIFQAAWQTQRETSNTPRRSLRAYCDYTGSYLVQSNGRKGGESHSGVEIHMGAGGSVGTSSCLQSSRTCVWWLELSLTQSNN